MVLNNRTHRSYPLSLLITTLVCLCCTLVPECSGRGTALYENILNLSELTGWTLESPAEYANSVESLTTLVDGAADAYWQKGVREVFLESFVHEGGSGHLELRWVRLKTSDEARRFFLDDCQPGENSAGGREKQGECIQELAGMSAAFFCHSRLVLEVSLDRPQKEGQPIFKALSQGFRKVRK